MVCHHLIYDVKSINRTKTEEPSNIRLNMIQDESSNHNFVLKSSTQVGLYKPFILDPALNFDKMRLQSLMATMMQCQMGHAFKSFAIIQVETKQKLLTNRSLKSCYMDHKYIL